MDEHDLARMNKVLRHRLRNVASGIKSAVNVLKEEVGETLPTAYAEYFPLLMQKCDQLTELTTRMGVLFDDIDKVKRMKTGAEDSEQATVGEVIEHTVARAHARWPAADLRVQCADEVAGLAVTPGHCLSVALFEVLRNAIEFSNPASVELACRETGGVLRLEVTDAGGGRELADDFEAIFLPFWTDRSGHEGIGLAVARRLVVSLDGKIEAHKNSSNGVTVVIEIPVS